MTRQGRGAGGRWRGARLVTGGFIMLVLALPAWAAPVVTPWQLPLMSMQVVRSNDPSCVGRCSDWIALQGQIGVGSARKFAQLIRSLGSRRLPVLVHSPGGSVRDGMAMGRLIRDKHLDVAVSRTVLTSCPADREACDRPAVPRVTTGAPLTTNAICASACSFILAGGERRFVALRSFVGVHQFRSFAKQIQVLRTFRTVTRKVDGQTVEVSRTLISERPVSSKNISIKTPEASYDDAQRYFAAMGITPRLMTLAEETPPASIHWLSLAELVATRMDTEGKDGTFLITHATADPPTPQASSRQTGTPVAAAPAAAGEEATVLVAETADQPAVHLAGHVVWSLDQSRPDPTLLASIALPDHAGDATMRFNDGARVQGRPAYRIELALQPAGPQSPLANVLAIGTPLVRTGSAVQTRDLPCTVHPPTLGAYAIDVSTDGNGTDAMRQLLAGDGTLEIPMIAASLRKLRLTLRPGPSGSDAFQHWRALVDAKLPAG